MRITQEEISKQYEIQEWIEIYESLKLVKPVFSQDCYNCEDKIINEKMWREIVYVPDDCITMASRGYSRFYICQRCAKTKIEAFKLFKGEKAFNWIKYNKNNFKEYKDNTFIIIILILSIFFVASIFIISILGMLGVI